MNPKTLEHWRARGWKLDEILLKGPGEVINTGGGPYYIGEAKEAGYLGNAHPLIVSRYAMGMRLGRPLTRNEIVKFRGLDKKDLRLSNLKFYSKNASPSELLRANLEPVLGYSHCLCECGTELDLEKQKIQPYAYITGHNKSLGDHKVLKRARPPMAKVLVEKLTKKEPMPTTPLEKFQGGYPLAIPEPETVEPPEEPLKEYRMLFEKMIHNLPWDEFKELLTLLLQIQTREKKL